MALEITAHAGPVFEGGFGAAELVQSVLGADETRWPVHGEKEKASKWHAWVLASDDAGGSGKRRSDRR
jgi:hypothetical protein